MTVGKLKISLIFLIFYTGILAEPKTIRNAPEGSGSSDDFSCSQTEEIIEMIKNLSKLVKNLKKAKCSPTKSDLGRSQVNVDIFEDSSSGYIINGDTFEGVELELEQTTKLVTSPTTKIDIGRATVQKCLTWDDDYEI